MAKQSMVNDARHKDATASKPTEEATCRTVVGGESSRVHQERYRVLIEDVEDGFYETGLKGDFLFFNDALCRIFGYPRDDIQNRNYRDFMDEKNAKKAFERFNHVYSTGKGITDIIWEIIRKDGQRRFVEISAGLIVDDDGNRCGFRGIVRDITEAKLVEKTNTAFFRIAKALPRYRRLDPLLEFIIKEVKDLLGVKGAMVILLDEEKKEFFFRVAAFDDSETGKRFKEVRFPIDKGVAGHVYRTGKPFMVPDTTKSPYFFKQVDEQAEYVTRNMLDVPLLIKDRFIGVLCAVNKTEAAFGQADIFVLSTIASMVALPIENARINDALNRSYEEVQSLSRAKESVIHHLSHELKTPVSVLAASMGLLRKKYAAAADSDFERILTRADRNLERILDIQYQTEDILREKTYGTYQLFSNLLDACTDEIEALAAEATEETDIIDAIRGRIEAIFGPKASPARQIRLDLFVKDQIDRLTSGFNHRRCSLEMNMHKVRPIFFPPDVLSKIVEGLIRNAVENTPDNGKIEISVTDDPDGPRLVVKDSGVGITEENRRLLFENYFTTHDTMQYGSKNRYDFNAGGKGFDLLRMKIFSERYRFGITMTSTRCRYIPKDSDPCPGDIEACRHCTTHQDCYASGGTTVVVRFVPASASEMSKMK